MAFDYSKLRGRIVERFGTQEAFAKALGMSTKTLSSKMGNKIYFRQDEINHALDLLEIDFSEAREYFFTPKVQQVELCNKEATA